LIGKPQPLGKSSMILQEVLGTTYEGYFPWNRSICDEASRKSTLVDLILQFSCPFLCIISVLTNLDYVKFVRCIFKVLYSGHANKVKSFIKMSSLIQKTASTENRNTPYRVCKQLMFVICLHQYFKCSPPVVRPLSPSNQKLNEHLVQPQCCCVISYEQNYLKNCIFLEDLLQRKF
jgi:hypothetical protein